MTSIYQEFQRKHQIAVHSARGELFGGTPTGGRFMGKPREFVLAEGTVNLRAAIRDDAVAYFANHAIQWWGGNGPSGHLLSSQIACVNHLFGLRHDPRGALGACRSIPTRS